MAWEKATDVIQTPATGVRAAHRTLHAGDMDLAQHDPSIRLGAITEEVREMARLRAETPQEQITTNALEQLQLARAYLEAREVHANDRAMDRMLERIVEERHGEDLRHSLSHGEKGIIHG